MKYFQGFVIPVKTANKQACLDMANNFRLAFFGGFTPILDTAHA